MKLTRKLNQTGASHLIIFVGLAVIVSVGAVGYYIQTQSSAATTGWRSIGTVSLKEMYNSKQVGSVSADASACKINVPKQGSKVRARLTINSANPSRPEIKALSASLTTTSGSASGNRVAQVNGNVSTTAASGVVATSSTATVYLSIAIDSTINQGIKNPINGAGSSVGKSVIVSTLPLCP